MLGVQISMVCVSDKLKRKKKFVYLRVMMEKKSVAKKKKENAFSVFKII